MTDPNPWQPPSPAPTSVLTMENPATPSRRRLLDAVAPVALAVVVAAFGPVLGWIWAAVAPRIEIIKTDGGFLYAHEEPEEAIAADGWFAILGAAAGLVFAVLAWVVLRRYRGVGVLLALVVGSLAAAVLAWRVGDTIGYAEFARAREVAAEGAHLYAPLGLRITDVTGDGLGLLQPTGVVAVQALVAAFVYTVLAGFSSYPDLRSPDPAEQTVADSDTEPDQAGSAPLQAPFFSSPAVP